jgi:hypothetical protein
VLCICASQWRVGFGGAYGLDYSAVFAAAQISGVELIKEDLDKIRAFETEVLSIWNKSGGQGPCNEEQKKQCKYEFGEYLDFTCRSCERNPNRDTGEGDIKNGPADKDSRND